MLDLLFTLLTNTKRVWLDRW